MDEKDKKEQEVCIPSAVYNSVKNQVSQRSLCSVFITFNCADVHVQSISHLMPLLWIWNDVTVLFSELTPCGSWPLWKCGKDNAAIVWAATKIFSLKETVRRRRVWVNITAVISASKKKKSKIPKHI